MVVWEIAIVLLLILLNGYFSMSELAIVSARRIRLQQMAEQGRRGAGIAIALAEDPGRFLSTVQVGITLVGVLTGAYGGATLAGYVAAWLRGLPFVGGSADALAFGLVVVAITYLTLIVGELVPKRVALVAAERIAIRVAGPMRLLARIAAPIVWLLQRSTEGVLALLGIAREKEAPVSEEEVRMMIAEGTNAGVFHQAEREMIESILRLADRTVQAIMTPRFDVVWLDSAAPPEEIRAKLAASGHSRLIVCKGEIDELQGVVQTKDIVDQAMQGRGFDLAAAIRPALVVHESTTTLRLLEIFRSAAVHMAVIVDEYGSLVGIATPMDILTAIAGDLPEPGRDEPPEAMRRDDGSWLIDGLMDLDGAERLLGRSGMREGHDFNTLAGFVLWRLGRLPRPGDAFEWEGYRFEVVDMDGRRIDKVLAAPLPEPGHEADMLPSPDDAGDGRP